jgi:hypothetical protein
MQKDTPMGKAYTKAKGAGGENDDVATRRYKTIAAGINGDTANAFKLIVTYDNVNNAVKVKVEDNKTKKSVYDEQWNQRGTDPMNASKITASIGRAVTSLTRNKLINKIDKDDVKALYEHVIDAWGMPSAETNEPEYDNPGKPKVSLAPGRAPKRKPGEPNAMKLPPGVNRDIFPKGYKA